MSNQKSTSGGFSFMTALLAIAICVVLGILIWVFVLGNKSHFDLEGHPKQGDLLGMMYSGGFIVPILLAIFMVIVTFSIERLITIGKAKGKGKADEFLRNIKSLLASNQYEDAIAACDKQQGSLANVVRSGIEKLQNVQNDSSLNSEDKIEAVQKELEEATSLELPMLSKNLSIITTCATIATLWGLIGTVLGMIRSFAAMSAAGSPDTAALTTGSVTLEVAVSIKKVTKRKAKSTIGVMSNVGLPLDDDTSAILNVFYFNFCSNLNKLFRRF